VVRKNSIRASCSHFLQPVLVLNNGDAIGPERRISADQPSTPLVGPFNLRFVAAGDKGFRRECAELGQKDEPAGSQFESPPLSSRASNATWISGLVLDSCFNESRTATGSQKKARKYQ
jgi:hypothetical protein